mmetsp:Transcript_32389/g.68556  ORF Transcript_32389/g.68556 Transcript_32389/m.68556 type:complete len:90 (-) Transcript_32389:1816-2085(-)
MPQELRKVVRKGTVMPRWSARFRLRPHLGLKANKSVDRSRTCPKKDGVLGAGGGSEARQRRKRNWEAVATPLRKSKEDGDEALRQWSRP